MIASQLVPKDETLLKKRMRLTVPEPSGDVFSRASRWFFNTPERALNRAYQAATTIDELEKKHFNSQPIGSKTDDPPSVNNYLCARRDKLLRNARMGLTEFRWATSLLGDPKGKSSEEKEHESQPILSDEILLSKLAFVDQVITRYEQIMAVPEPEAELASSQDIFLTGRNNSQKKDDEFMAASSVISPAQKTGIIPRSILRTGRRLKRELDPKHGEKVLKEYEISSYRTKRAVRFLLVLILIPLLTQQASKRLVFAPTIEYVVDKSHIEVPLSEQLEREAIEEISFFEKQLQFESTAGIIAPLSYSEYREMVNEKAQEVTHEFSHERISAVENVFADLLAAGIFAWILFANSRAVKLLKSFIDDIIYGLSDSAKAFLIILSTDMFVGFHSPHGWEVLLEGVAHHFGLPENRDFIFLFIATFPVILDAIFKYWIFRYLSRVSPSAVATYRNMNE